MSRADQLPRGRHLSRHTLSPANSREHDSPAFKRTQCTAMMHGCLKRDLAERQRRGVRTRALSCAYHGERSSWKRISLSRNTKGDGDIRVWGCGYARHARAHALGCAQYYRSRERARRALGWAWCGAPRPSRFVLVDICCTASRVEKLVGAELYVKFGPAMKAPPSIHSRFSLTTEQTFDPASPLIMTQSPSMSHLGPLTLRQGALSCFPVSFAHKPNHAS